MKENTKYSITEEDHRALAKVFTAVTIYRYKGSQFPVDIKEPIQRGLFSMEDYIHLKVFLDEAKQLPEERETVLWNGKEYLDFVKEATELLGKFKNTFAQRNHINKKALL